MVRDADLPAAIESRVKALRQFRGTEAYRHFVLLLEEMKQAHLLALVDVPDTELKLKQGAVRQVVALHSALMADIPLSPLA
jgi:hypothetical protein